MRLKLIKKSNSNNHNIKISLVSLGCEKNLVDSELILGLLEKNKYAIESDALKSDGVIINTCGFINDAKTEALDNIFYYLDKNKLQREVRNNAGQTTTETVLEHVASFTVDNDPTDIKQIFVKLSVKDPEKKLKRDVDFAVRLETDFVYVDVRDL